MQRIYRIATLGILFLLSGMLAGCAGFGGGMEESRIEGSVWYKERMMIPPDATVTVSLEDVSRADAPSVTIASKEFKPEGGPPYAFSLAYDADRILKRNRYSLRAKIMRDNKLLFISTQAVPAFANDSGTPVNILVSRVNASISSDNGPGGVSAAAAAPGQVKMTETFWKLVELNGNAIKNDVGVRAKEINIVLHEEGTRAVGFAGCNNFSGSYTLSGNDISFGALISTQMACLAGMDVEDSYLKMLQETTHFKQERGVLTFFNDSDEAVLKYNADDMM
ncbi:YbaY family lipoprotein [Marinobacter sp. BGYM27]|uniref:YbaY family lipoprotein n=1 Tax=Marinobacter sp. BGYM27 TaxID=2975597 RepID=UPI0021A79BB7|nr:YbaY family lipoprotein [Marinobacter sp. BGYM27]MDG5500189.1 YbaY family lipoprotein [Marinobacter sp. BGYM27]